MSEYTPAIPQIMGDTVRYVAATSVTQAVTFVMGLVIKRLLGPVNVGIWASLALVVAYLDFAQFRIADAAQKEIAYRRGRGEQAVADQLRDVMFTVWLAVSAVLGLGVMLVAWLALAGPMLEYRVGLAVIGASYPITQLTVCYTVMFRCHKRFGVLSRTLVILAVLGVALQIPLTLAWGFYGYMLAYVLAQALNVLYWRYWVRDRDLTRFCLRWHWPTLRRLLEVGIPWEIGLVVGTLFRSLDQVLLVCRLGPAALGLYSIGVSMNNYVYGIPNAIAVVTFPNFQERYGQTDDPSALLNLIVLPVLTLSFLILPVAMGGVYLFMPPLVRQALPDFVGGIAAAQVLAMGTFSLSLRPMAGQFMITINRQWPSVALGAVSTGVLAAGVYLALRLGMGIVGVAAATAVAYTFSSGSILVLAVTLASSWQAGLGLFFKCSLAIGWTWLALALADRLRPFGTYPWWLDFGTSAVKFGLFLVLIIPLFWYFERSTGMLKVLLRAVCARLSGRFHPMASSRT